MKKILLFGFHDFLSGMTVHNLSENGKAYGIEVQNVAKEEYLCPLGILAKAAAGTPGADGHQKYEKYEGEELKVRMLLFAGISEKELDQVMELCRQSGITPDDLKAVLTPYNALWNAVSLCKELIAEHAQMKGQGSCLEKRKKQ